MHYFNLALFLVLLTITVFPQDIKKDVEEIFNSKASEEDGFYKFSFPRSDLNVELNDISLSPGFAFTSWIAFHPMEHNTMIMGDLVLLDAEIGNVVKKLKEKEINITALHNHIINEVPSVMYMHFGATGDAVDLAKKMKEVLSLTKTPLVKKEEAIKEDKAIQDWSIVEKILGKEGNKKSNLVSFGFPRKETILENGHPLPKTFGIHTAITFQMVQDKAIVTGDYVMTADEVNDVIKVLTENNIVITALHNHMINEEPRLFFMHFFGYAEPESLAKGIRAALEKTNSNY